MTTLFFFSSSWCTGITHISEDSSEIAFLLVENYQLTASVGPRDRLGIFGTQLILRDLLFISLLALATAVLGNGEEKSEVNVEVGCWTMGPAVVGRVWSYSMAWRANNIPA